MVDIEKLVKSILAFVNFFSARIAVSILLVLLVRSFSGTYYFDLARDYFNNGVLATVDLSSFITRAGGYFDPKNVQNALFAIALIFSLSLLDMIYRLVQLMGSLLPVGMLYNATYALDEEQFSIGQAWRFYSNKFDLSAFRSLVDDRAQEIRSKARSSTRWWDRLFQFSKSFIVILIVLWFVTPRDHIQFSLSSVIFYCTLALACMLVSTMIESARYANDVGLSLRAACLALTNEAKTDPISNEELSKVMQAVSGGSSKAWWGSRFFCVKTTLLVPYVGSIDQMMHDYRRWDNERKLRARFGNKEQKE